MNKIQPPPFTTYIGLLISVFTTASIAQSRPATQAYLDSNPSVYLLSGNNFCHGPLSEAQASVLLKAPVIAGGPPTNMHITLDSCKAAGGKLTQTEALKLQVNQFVSLQQMVVEDENGKQAKQQKAKNEQQEESDSNEFVGISWGIGLAFTYLSEPIIGDINIVTEESAPNGTILVEHQSKHRAIAMLESHYFFERSWLGDCLTIKEFKIQPDKTKCDTTWGHGPFIAIGITGNEEIDPLSTYGIGWMWGFRKAHGKSWNIGLGLFVDTKANQLRPEFSDKSPTTLSDKDQLTYLRDEVGPMLMFSSTF